jgi:transcriptional regulator with XRE-family HTH domain
VAQRTRKNGGAGARAGGERHVALGERLREERNRRGLSLRELARRLDVSPSLVSQIETGKIQPSLDDVFASADPGRAVPDDPAAGRARADGASGSASGGPVQRADSRTVIDLEAGVRWERLTTENERDVEFLLTVYPAGSESAPADGLVRHTGREFGIVLSGRLRVTVGFEDYELGPGDSVSFDSTVPHRLRNEGDETVEAVWVVLGRQR